VRSESAGQRKAFQFLLNKFKTQEEFTRDEFCRASAWPKASTFKTYWTKQFKGLLIQTDATHYRVGEVFRRFASWERFQLHVTQNRRAASAYTNFAYDSVMQFEFFMPLSNEAQLRLSLDALFFKNAILTRLKRVKRATLTEMFPCEDGESDSVYLERLLKWISEKFCGYSISHVNGRYRSSKLKSLDEVYQTMADGVERYLIDETTAVVRFIIRCGNPKQNKFDSLEHVTVQPLEEEKGKVVREVARIRFFFNLLFVQSIVEFVAGEEEIWLLESGFQNRLYIWKVQNEALLEFE